MDHEETGIQRFGDYLRSLRQDRRLTLERIEALSRENRDPVSKTWLSRCEHAQTEPSLGRLSTLARIYRIRLGELAERYEIERELALREERPRRDVPADPVEAAERGIEAAREADAERCLALLDAAQRAAVPPEERAAFVTVPDAASANGTDPAEERYASGEPAPGAGSVAAFGRAAEARSRLCLAVLSGATGNYRVCREEAEALFAGRDVPDDIRLRAAVQLAFAWRKLHRAPLARLVLTSLLERGVSLPARLQADAHLLMGCLDLDEGIPRPALLHLRKAVALFRAEGTPADLCRALQELGEAYRASGRLEEAMLRYQEGWTIARRSDLRPIAADLLSHLGRGHYLLGHHATAARLLRESTDAARRTESWEVQFRNAWYLRALAARTGDEFARRTCERTLRQLLNRADPFSEEALDYRQEIARKDGRFEPVGTGPAASPQASDAAGAGDDAGPSPPIGCGEPGAGGFQPDTQQVSDRETTGTSAAIEPPPPPRYRSLGRPGRGGELVPLSRNRTRGDQIVRGSLGSD